jgi:NAD(P)-dependent dehydrogenase (short-subunit alcohol dehydrogenase family)
MTDVAGRTAFITGGANGIGLGIARAFAGAGAKLALADVDADALAAAKAELSAITPTETVVLDVRDREAYAAAADQVEAALGPVSLLFNNAGVAGSAPVTKLSYALWDWAMGINLDGPINGVQTFLPRMAARGGGGHIVNTASGAGLVEAGSGVMYHTAKFGVVGLSESLRPELRSLGIGVSVLCPGPVATGIIDRTSASRPSGLRGMSETDRERAAVGLARAKAMLATGVNPDDVGQMVLKAVQDGQFYIHTDRTVAGLVARRTEEILAAFPPE